MPSVQIADFKYGIDRSRPRSVGIPGTLWSGVNCHITRGGDIESAKKFVSTYTLPAGTYGLEQVSGQLFVFGSANLAASMPNGVQYQRLQNSSAVMTRILWSNTFAGQIYAIAEYDDGNILHFYNGSAVTALNALADAAASYTTLATHLARKLKASSAVDALSFGSSILVTAKAPGTAFTLSSATVDNGANNDQTATVSTVQANVAEVAEVRATGTVTITGGTRDPGVNRVAQVTVDGVDLMEVPVDWVSSNNATATAVAVEINNRTSTHGFSASAASGVVTIQAEPGTGASPNGDVVAIDTDGNVTASTANMSGGVTHVAPVAQISKVVFGGTFQAADKFTLTLNSVAFVATGRASAYPTSAFVYKGREYATADSLLRFCKLNDPTNWTDADASTGAGAINVSSDSQGNQRLVGLSVYQTSVAVFAELSIRVYDLFADASLASLRQVLENCGTRAPRSIMPYFNSDLLYLDEPGIRSVQVRDVNGNAFIEDTGTQIDPLVQDWIASLPEATVERAVAVIEPIDGRYMLAIDERIFVLSHFPRKKISAWTYYEPGFVVTDFARVARRLYARDTGTIYLYGGVDGDTYPDADEQEIEIELPFTGVKSPADFKNWTGFDCVCSGTWLIEMLVDSTDEAKKVTIGRVVDTTLNHGGIAAVGESTLFAVRATCASGGRATMSSLQVHYEGGDSES